MHISYADGRHKVSEGLWNGLKFYVESFAYVRNVKSGHDAGIQNKRERQKILNLGTFPMTDK